MLGFSGGAALIVKAQQEVSNARRLLHELCPSAPKLGLEGGPNALRDGSPRARVRLPGSAPLTRASPATTAIDCQNENPARELGSHPPGAPLRGC